MIMTGNTLSVIIDMLIATGAVQASASLAALMLISSVLLCTVIIIGGDRSMTDAQYRKCGISDSLAALSALNNMGANEIRLPVLSALCL